MFNFLKYIQEHCGLLGVLIDPDKDSLYAYDWGKLNQTADFLLIGGSTVREQDYHSCLAQMKQLSSLPVIGFPGDARQFSRDLDALLYLSLLSGRNAEYLIGQHIESAREIGETGINVLPTAYLLLGSENESAVRKVSNTEPISFGDLDLLSRTAWAAKLLGKKMIYLDAGSGAVNAVELNCLQTVQKIGLPVMIGGGLRSIEQVEPLYQREVSAIIIGNGLENNDTFLNDLFSWRKSHRLMLRSSPFLCAAKIP